MDPNEVLIQNKMIVQGQSRNGSLMDMFMDWHNIAENQNLIPSPLFLPCYINYEKYGNGLSRYLSEITRYLKSTKLMNFDGFNDYIELNMVYTEEQGHPSFERLMRYIDGNQKDGCGFQGVVLLHIDEWCSHEYRLRDKRFLAILQYLEERRSRLLVIFQTSYHCYTELLEQQLQQKFNIRVIDSIPLSLEYIVEEIKCKLQEYGFKLNEEAIHYIEALANSFKDVKEVDSFQQIKLVIEDVIYEYMKNTDSNDRLITGKHFQHSVNRNKLIISKNEHIFGFELKH